MDWTLSNTARLMVRYTQDSWTNNAPNVYAEPLGRRSVPGRGLELGPAGPIVHGPADPQHRVEERQHPDLLVLGQQDHHHPRRDEPRAERPDQRRDSSIFPISAKEYGDRRGHPVLLGRPGYATLWNEAPFRNNQDLYVLKDDYSAVFGKHMLKAGVLVSTNKKNEDTDRYRLLAELGTSGARPARAQRLAQHREHPVRLPAEGHDLRLLRDSGSRQVPTTWNDLEFYVSDSWKVEPARHRRLRGALVVLFNSYTADDKMTSFVPSLFNPALGSDPCNGLLQVPGTNPCQDAGFLGGTAGPNRSLQDQKYNALAPRLGVAWDVFGDGQDGRARGPRAVLPARAAQRRAELRRQPALRRDARRGLRYLDTQRRAVRRRFQRERRRAHERARAERGHPQLLDVEPHLRAASSSRNTTLELSYVGTKQQDQLHFYDVDQVRTGDMNGNGVADRLDFVRAGGDTGVQAAVRPYGVFGNAHIIIWGHGGKANYHALQTQVVSRFGRGSQFQASYTWSKSTGNLPLADSGGIEQRQQRDRPGATGASTGADHDEPPAHLQRQPGPRCCPPSRTSRAS